MLLAHAFAEGRRPPDALWTETLVASRLLEYESWVRIHSRGVGKSHGEILERVGDRPVVVHAKRRLERAPAVERAGEKQIGGEQAADRLRLAR